MPRSRAPEGLVPPRDPSVFVDGDTLIISLTALPEFDRQSDSLRERVRPGTCLESVLVDCSALSPPRTPDNLAGFIETARWIIRHGLRLLLLDACPGLYRTAAPLLPQAIWINSSQPDYSCHRSPDMQTGARPSPPARRFRK